MTSAEAHYGIVSLVFCLGNKEVLVDGGKWSGFWSCHVSKVRIMTFRNFTMLSLFVILPRNPKHSFPVVVHSVVMMLQR